jgi:hypothetical protein
MNLTKERRAQLSKQVREAWAKKSAKEKRMIQLKRLETRRLNKESRENPTPNLPVPSAVIPFNMIPDRPPKKVKPDKPKSGQQIGNSTLVLNIGGFTVRIDKD